MAGCTQSPDPWVTSQRQGQGIDVSPVPTESTELTENEVAAQLPTALKNFEGTFPNDDYAAVLAKLESTFEAQRENARGDEPPGPVHFGPGAAESMVLTEWLCSWERVYVDSLKRDDAAGIAKADAQLRTYYSLDYAKQWVDDPEHGWEKEVLKPAQLGEVGPMASDIRMSCPR